MAEVIYKRISDLDSAAQPLGGTEIAEISQGGVSRKVTLTSIFGSDWWAALRAAFTSFVAPEATHAVSADMSAACSGNSATASSADTATTALYAMNFDYVIDSDAKLLDWQGMTSGCEKVLIKKGTWTLASGGVDLTARGTKVVIGEPGSKLVFSASANGLYYSTRPTTNDYKMDGINVECSNTSGSVLAIRDCINLKECTAVATSYGAASTAGFAYCYNMINCIGTGSGSTVGSGFSDCLYCVNCKGFGSGSNEGIGFGSCRYLSGCYASGTGIGTGIGDGLKSCLRVTICESYGYTGTGSSYGMSGCKSCTNNKAFAGTANYSNSYADAGTSYPCADTPNGGFNS